MSCWVPTSSSTPAASISAGVTRLASARYSRTRSLVQPASMSAAACSGPSTATAWPPLPTGYVAGQRMAAAIVVRIPSGDGFRTLATWRGPSVPRIVTVESSLA